MSRLFLAFVLTVVAANGSLLAADPPLGDPMRPYSPASPAAAGQRAARPLTLSGVLVATNRRVAVINGELYREGDTVNGARIVRIERDSVQLRRGSEVLALQLERRIAITRTNNGESVQ